MGSGHLRRYRRIFDKKSTRLLQGSASKKSHLRVIQRRIPGGLDRRACTLMRPVTPGNSTARQQESRPRVLCSEKNYNFSATRTNSGLTAGKALLSSLKMFVLTSRSIQKRSIPQSARMLISHAGRFSSAI